VASWDGARSAAREPCSKLPLQQQPHAKQGSRQHRAQPAAVAQGERSPLGYGGLELSLRPQHRQQSRAAAAASSFSGKGRLKTSLACACCSTAPWPVFWQQQTVTRHQRLLPRSRVRKRAPRPQQEAARALQGAPDRFRQAAAIAVAARQSSSQAKSGTQSRGSLAGSRRSVWLGCARW